MPSSLPKSRGLVLKTNEPQRSLDEHDSLLLVLRVGSQSIPSQQKVMHAHMRPYAVMNLVSSSQSGQRSGVLSQNTVDICKKNIFYAGISKFQSRFPDNHDKMFINVCVAERRACLLKEQRSSNIHVCSIHLKTETSEISCKYRKL